jgi:hypothetical protein
MKRRSLHKQQKKVRDGIRKDSRYKRKRQYLHKAGKWGWEIPEPKPWKS